MNIIKFAVIGLGVGERHVDALSRHADVSLASVCDFNSEKAKSIAEKYQINHWCSDWHEVLKIADLQAIVIASYDHNHAEQIISFLKRGIHIFVEKPLCTTKEELTLIEKEYIKASKNKHIYMSTNFILRKEKRFLELKNKILSGELGQIYSIEASYDYGRIHKIIDGWRSKSPNYSVMNGGGIHMIDLCQWLVDKKYNPKFSLHNKTSTKEINFVYSEFTSSMGHLGKEIVFKVTANFGSQTPHFHQLNVYGTKGTFINSCGRGTYYFGHEPEVKSIEDCNIFPNASKGDLLPNFVKAITDKTPLEIPYEELVQVMRVSLEVDSLAKASIK